MDRCHTVYLHHLQQNISLVMFMKYFTHLNPVKYDPTHHLLHLLRGFLDFGLGHSHGLVDDGCHQSAADPRAEEVVPVVEADPVGIRHHGTLALEAAADRLEVAEEAERNLYSLAVHMAGTRYAMERLHCGQGTEYSWHHLPWEGHQGLEDMADSMRRQMRWEVSVAGPGRQSSLVCVPHRVLLPWSVCIVNGDAASAHS